MRNHLSILFASSVLLLSGCAAAPVFTSISTPSGSVRGHAIAGRVHGGQSPIAGASIYLYAANTTGYGNASVSLLNSSGSNTHQDTNGKYYVLTDANGNFSITGDYICPSTTSQVYIYSVGGNPGLPMGAANPAAGLLAALGTCPASGTLSSSLYVVVSEVSTIAAAYAIAGYAIDATHVSSSSSTLAATGVANAFLAAANLETLGTGAALATTPAANGGNGTVPQSEIDTLANILAACVNSNGAVTGPANPTPCYTLFTNALSAGATGTQPTETATAAINIAHNPSANVGNLFGLQAGSPPFVPDQGVAPNDFTIAISFTGGGLNEVSAVAVDASGNVWAANIGGNSISKFNPLGKPLSGSGYTGGGIDAPIALAIDSSGNVWAASGSPNNSVNELSSTGSPVSASGYTGNGLDNPCSIAIDASSHVWVANCATTSISEFSTGGSSISIVTSGGLNHPDGVAIDASGNVWAANGDKDTISEFDSSGAANENSPFSGGGLIFPNTVAVDASNNVWVANENLSISEFSSAGSAVSGASGDSGAGLAEPFALAIDGAGNVWAADNGFNSADTYDIGELNSSGAAISGDDGFEGGSLSVPDGIAVDGSGNVWVANNSSSNITEFVGAASPVVTPIVANLLAPYGGSAVNKP